MFWSIQMLSFAEFCAGSSVSTATALAILSVSTALVAASDGLALEPPLLLPPPPTQALAASATASAPPVASRERADSRAGR